jgi:hypothetical protein
VGGSAGWRPEWHVQQASWRMWVYAVGVGVGWGKATR